MDDVQAVRENVTEEQHETAEVRNEAAENVAQARQNEQAVRHEVMKPVTQGEAGDIRDAKQETAEAKQEGAQAIQEEKQETAAAKAELRDTEASYKATQARDKFVSDHEAKLKAASERIDALETQADKQEGAAKEATDKQVSELQTGARSGQESARQPEIGGGDCSGRITAITSTRHSTPCKKKWTSRRNVVRPSLQSWPVRERGSEAAPQSARR